MKTQQTPTAVRLAPKAAEALKKLAEKNPGASRSAIVESALVEAATLPERIPISQEEFVTAANIHKYLCNEYTAYSTGPKKTEDCAAEKALAASVTAIMLKRVFLEAKGRIVISKT